jgi:putative addiction module component (TIGR02574 family)
MSHRSAQILKDALSLPAPERIELVEQLMASLDFHARKETNELWAQESEDRIEAFERGEIPTVAAQDVFYDIRER